MKDSLNFNYHLDETDKQIIYMLVDNAKTSLAIISSQVGISVSFLNPRKIGYKVICFIGVFLDKPSYYQDAIKALNNINEVVEAHYTTGNYTILLKVLCIDNDHLMEILNQLQKLDGVTRTETFLSLEQSISRQLRV
jgi:Lrp/AsnC family transcriptional regulator, regulator for asnA, asnC and gidA